MELVEKTELFRRFSVYALPKIHLEKHRAFCKILLVLSGNINLNPEPGLKMKIWKWIWFENEFENGFENENLLQVILFYDCIFFQRRLYYKLNSMNVSKNEWGVFEKRGKRFIYINKSHFAVISKVFLVKVFCPNLSQS